MERTIPPMPSPVFRMAAPIPGMDRPIRQTAPPIPPTASSISAAAHPITTTASPVSQMAAPISSTDAPTRRMASRVLPMASSIFDGSTRHHRDRPSRRHDGRSHQQDGNTHCRDGQPQLHRAVSPVKKSRGDPARQPTNAGPRITGTSRWRGNVGLRCANPAYPFSIHHLPLSPFAFHLPPITHARPATLGASGKPLPSL